MLQEDFDHADFRGDQDKVDDHDVLVSRTAVAHSRSGSGPRVGGRGGERREVHDGTREFGIRCGRQDPDRPHL